MKNTLKSILALAMVICMLFTIAGCGDAKKDASSQQSDDGFFTEAETQNESATTDASSQTDGSSQTQSSGKDSGSKVTTTVPKENTIGGKSWKDVLANMPKKLRGTTLVMYNWNPATEYTGAPAVMDQFTKQTGIKVEWRTIPGIQNYRTKLPALIASGENIPDMVRNSGPIPSIIQNMQPLSVAKYDFTDEAWDKDMMKLYSFNGKSYATTLKNTHIGGVVLLFYNKSLINKYDFEDPYKLWKNGKWTWDKYIKMCEDAVEEGLSSGSNGEGHFGRYLSTWGISGAISYNGKKFTSNWNNSNFLKVHQTLGDLYNKDKLFAFGGEASFDDGKVLFSIGTAIHARKKNSYFGNLKSNNTLYAVPMPEHPELKKYYQGHGEAEAYSIPKGAPNPEAVPYFLRYFLDGSNYELATYFCNEQNLEVYNWCMNQKNKVYSYGYPDALSHLDNTGIQKQTAGQMKSYIDANKGVVDKMVKEYNETAAKIK